MSAASAEFFRYLPVSERDMQWELYVTGAGFSSVPPRSPYPRDVHPQRYHFAWQRGRVLPEYQVLYITRGAGRFESEVGGARHITAGSVLLLFPGVWHRYQPEPETGWDEFWVSYNGDWPRRLVERQFLTPASPLLTVGLDDAVLQPYLTLLDRVRWEQVGYQQLIAANVMEILSASLAAARNARVDGRRAAAIREAKTLLAQRTEEPVDTRQMAAALHMSYAHFRRLFKQQTGLSPYQYHLQLRINRARELLHGTTLSVKQIATRLNFENPYHFSKIFKRKTGMAPQHFRGGNS